MKTDLAIDFMLKIDNPFQMEEVLTILDHNSKIALAWLTSAAGVSNIFWAFVAITVLIVHLGAQRALLHGRHRQARLDAEAAIRLLEDRLAPFNVAVSGIWAVVSTSMYFEIWDASGVLISITCSGRTRREAADEAARYVAPRLTERAFEAEAFHRAQTQEKAKAERAAAPTRPADDPWWVVLGVKKTSTLSDINSAFRKAAHLAHPDHGGDIDRMTCLIRARDLARRAVERPAGF